MDAFFEVLRIMQMVILASLVAASFGKWRRRSVAATAWFAATLAFLTAGSVINHLLSETTPAGVGPFEGVVVGRKILILSVVLVPYALFRFAASFRSEPRWRMRVAAGATAAVCAWALFLPSVPGRGEPRAWYVMVLGAGLAIQWTTLSAVAVWRLWSAGRTQPTVARLRMRTLAAAALSINVPPIVAGAIPGERGSPVEVATTVFALVSAVFFYVGYFPPTILRISWRRGEEATLREAAGTLISATTGDEVAVSTLPYAARMLGARGVVLAGPGGEVLAAHALSDEDARVAVAQALGASPRRDPSVSVLGIAAGNHLLVALTGPETPFFGEEEVALAQTLAINAALAFERAALFERERDARLEVERVNGELEAFVYSASHDLKRPIISLGGYMDYLRADFGDLMPSGGRHYLDRMAVSLGYMEALIGDLLELSRIGRVDAEPADVDMEQLITEIVNELRVRHRRSRFETGGLPVVRLNPLRARQLFTNLLTNAVEHSGKSDVVVRVSAESTPGGVARICVADDGRGIEPEFRERVFEPFERLDVAPHPGEGTGIGLAICHKIAERAGGRIWIGDAAVGTSVFVELPIPSGGQIQAGETRGRETEWKRERQPAA